MRLLPLLAALALSACAAPRPPAAPAAPVAAPVATLAAAIEADIRAVMKAQVVAWNDGDIRGFMEGYARTDTLTFLSGGSVRTGWEEAYYGYVRAYPDQATMGVLTFSELDVQPLSARHALVWGRWRLQRASDAPGGLFTLLFEATDDGWRVVHDHTSSE